LEVQERSSSALVLLECLKENPGLAQELMETFEGELNPVAPKAQRKVGIYLIIVFVILLLCYIIIIYYICVISLIVFFLYIIREKEYIC